MKLDNKAAYKRQADKVRRENRRNRKLAGKVGR